MKGKPLPFRDEDFQKFWKPEPWDELVPEGFLSDFVLSSRGIETPTNFTLWSGLFLISSALKRDSWLRWYPSVLVPNLFVIIVGPPRVLAKSTAINYGEGKILSKFHEKYENEGMRLRKRANIVRKSTPEALSIALAPEVAAWFDPATKKRYEIDRGSQVCLIVDELATLLGKQKYNVGLVDRLIKLYDCKDEDDELTISRGHVEFHNMFTTLFGGTTPDGLVNSLPQEVYGTGFMSRLIIVNGEAPTRSFPIPLAVKRIDGSAVDWAGELQLRLAWLAEKSLGEFTLAPETEALVIEWYHGFKKNLTRMFANMDKNTLMRARFDTHLYKLMILLRAQSYEHKIDDPEAKVIQPKDFHMAKRILERTYQENFSTVADSVTTSPTEKWSRRVLKLLKDSNGQAEKRWLFPRMSPYGCLSNHMKDLLHQLSEEDKIEIIGSDGLVKAYPSSDGREVYRLKAKEFTLNGLSQSHDTSILGQDEEDLSGSPQSGQDVEASEDL